MKRARTLPLLLLLAALLAIPALATATRNPNPGVVPPRGDRYGQWGADWWTWALAIPVAHNPMYDTTGADCAVGQRGRIWYLAGTVVGPVERSCTIPHGRSIFFPLINWENDYPCPDPTFQPPPGQTLEEFLTAGAKAGIDQVHTLQAWIDGVPLRNLFDYRGTSRLFTFTGDLSLRDVFDPCITGTPQPAVSDGYWLMLEPLSTGRHTIRFHAEMGMPTWGSQDVTWHLKIKR